MENDAGAPRHLEPEPEEPLHHSSPTTAEARVALADLDADGARLADRVVTPWWYHPILALIVAVIVGSQALSGPGTVMILPLAIIALPFLVIAYSRHSGVTVTHPAGPRSKRLLIILVVLMIMAMASGLVVKLTGLSPGWVLIPAALAATATLVLGRRYDAVLRAELARPSDAR
ncbi:hypothetical protein [Brachybacterium sp. FME24]|uniref:hypothetical protein n=1 Tax=Brachybacterium sp. FME24 TaxID=2742605 RepID=UPI0018670D36|nr:hypothetical protein [Brachybacterium sp. FME24]